MNDSDFVEPTSTHNHGSNPNPNPPTSTTSQANDDYDIYSFDDGDDYFNENSNTKPLESQRINPSTSLEPISTSAIRLVQQSISRIKSSASSTGLFGVSDEKSSSMETKGLVVISSHSRPCLTPSPSLTQGCWGRAHHDQIGEVSLRVLPKLQLLLHKLINFPNPINLLAVNLPQSNNPLQNLTASHFKLMRLLNMTILSQPHRSTKLLSFRRL
jgi:hypothetical protein